MNILEYENCQEKKSHGDPLFPYTTYLCSIPLDFSCVPLHWHEEMELIYIKKGTGRISIDLHPAVVRGGDLALILPGQLHSIQQRDGAYMEYENIIFQPNLLYSRQEDVCSSDFLKPLFAGELALPGLLTPEMAGYGEILSCIDRVDEICRTFPQGYPLAIKSELYRFFYLLLPLCGAEIRTPQNHPSLEKVKQIVKYVEQNYPHRISIAEIASEVGFSESHFMRYFRQAMGTSFVEYLNEYRLTMAARLLIASSASILEVASEVGFDNLSYFNRLFKKRFGLTPSQYRRGR